MRTFKASVKRNNEFTFLINTQNSDDFYLYEGPQTTFKHNQIYPENQLLFKGCYVFPSSKQAKRLALHDEGYTILLAQNLSSNYKSNKSVILRFSRKGWQRFIDETFSNLEAANEHIAYLCASKPKHIHETDY